MYENNGVFTKIAKFIDAPDHRMAHRSEQKDTKDIALDEFKTNGIYNRKREGNNNPGEIKAVSYNIEKGKKYEEIRDTLETRISDARKEGKTVVIGLQEVKDKDMALQLAEDLDMNVAYKEPDGESRSHKAILSDGRIKSARDVKYKQDVFTGLVDALKENWKSGKAGSEPLEQRSILEAEIYAGGKSVHVLNTHLTLGSPENNAMELNQLRDRAEKYDKNGSQTIIMGDLNDDLSRKDYGNRKNWQVNDNIKGLQANFDNTWNKAKEKKVVYDNDRVSFEEAMKKKIGTKEFITAREEYLSISPKDEEKKKKGALDKLKGIYDSILGRGVTHLTAGMGKGTRFDNILVSRDVQVDSWESDYGAKGSDHQPVAVDIVV